MPADDASIAPRDRPDHPTGTDIFDEWSERVFLAEIGLQCNSALRAGQMVEESITGASAPDHEGLHFATQTFLTSAANLSKLLFPIVGRPGQHGATEASLAYRSKRGEVLRERLGVEANSPLKSRAVRDVFEHIDERLDAWVRVQPRPTADDIEADGGDTRAVGTPPPVRVVHHEQRRVSVAGQDIDLRATLHEIKHIRERLVELHPPSAQMPSLAGLLALLPPWPPELRLDAPSRRPDEDVRAGLTADDGPSLDDLIAEAASTIGSSEGPTH